MGRNIPLFLLLVFKNNPQRVSVPQPHPCPPLRPIRGPKALIKAFGAKPAPLPLPQRDSLLNLDEEGRQTSQTHSQASHLLSSPACHWSIHPKPSLSEALS